MEELIDELGTVYSVRANTISRNINTNLPVHPSIKGRGRSLRFADAGALCPWVWKTCLIAIALQVAFPQMARLVRCFIKSRRMCWLDPKTHHQPARHLLIDTDSDQRLRIAVERIEDQRQVSSKALHCCKRQSEACSAAHHILGKRGAISFFIDPICLAPTPVNQAHTFWRNSRHEHQMQRAPPQARPRLFLAFASGEQRFFAF